MVIKTHYDEVILQDEGELVSAFFDRIAGIARDMEIQATDFSREPPSPSPMLTHVRLERQQPAEGDRYADLSHRPLIVSLGVTTEREV